jgi:hypothetical protein
VASYVSWELVKAARAMQNLPDTIPTAPIPVQLAAAERKVPWSCGFQGCSVGGSASSEGEAAQQRAQHMASCPRGPR